MRERECHKLSRNGNLTNRGSLRGPKNPRPRCSLSLPCSVPTRLSVCSLFFSFFCVFSLPALSFSFAFFFLESFGLQKHPPPTGLGTPNTPPTRTPISFQFKKPNPLWRLMCATLPLPSRPTIRWLGRGVLTEADQTPFWFCVFVVCVVCGVCVWFVVCLCTG